MGYFQVRYDCRVVNYDCRGFIRLATVSLLQRQKVVRNNKMSAVPKESRKCYQVLRSFWTKDCLPSLKEQVSVSFTIIYTQLNQRPLYPRTDLQYIIPPFLIHLLTKSIFFLKITCTISINKIIILMVIKGT